MVLSTKHFGAGLRPENSHFSFLAVLAGQAPGKTERIAEFARLDITGLENDGLEIGRLVPAARAAAVPQPRCCEV